MLITLQEGCDYIVRRKANAALGLIPEWRDHLLATWEEDRTTDLGGIPVNLSADPLDASRQALRKIRDAYWLAVENDLDSPEELRMLTLVDGIPKDARSTRVTRTSLATLLQVKLNITILDWLSVDVRERLEFDESAPLKKRERTLLCIVALAAREIAKTNSKVVKPDTSINKDAIASLLMKNLSDAEKRNGLTVDTIGRVITSGLEELT